MVGRVASGEALAKPLVIYNMYHMLIISVTQGLIRVCRQSAVLPSKLSVQPLPPPHVSITQHPLVNLTPPYRELTQWIRGLLADNQLTMEHIRQLRKPFRVVSTRGSAKQADTPAVVVHRVECVIYPKPFNIISCDATDAKFDDEIKDKQKVDKEGTKINKDIIDNDQVGRFVSSLHNKVLSRDSISCEREHVTDVGGEGFLVEDDDVITLVLNGGHQEDSCQYFLLYLRLTTPKRNTNIHND